MPVTGTWNLEIATPLGRQDVVLRLDEDGGVLRGHARSAAEEVPLVDPTLTGNRLTWSQSITRPLRLNLTFVVTVDGDTMVGTSKAGRLPRSKVSGTRVP
jgi:hypothetical protein